MFRRANTVVSSSLGLSDTSQFHGPLVPSACSVSTAEVITNGGSGVGVLGVSPGFL